DFHVTGVQTCALPISYETARVRLGADGRIWVHSGAASAGQSHKTTLAQIVAEVLSVDLVDVRVVSGDTDLAPDGIGTFASRTAEIGRASCRERGGLMG